MFRQLVESTFNQPAFRTYSQSVRHGISAVLTLPAIFYHTIEFLADRRRFNPFTKKKSVELQCHVFVEGRRKTLMSRCSNSSPRYSVRTTMPSLLILKISYVFNNKISITLLSFLICLGRSFPNPNTKVMKSCDNHLCCNRFICSLFKIGILQFHPSAFPLRLYRSVYALP